MATSNQSTKKLTSELEQAVDEAKKLLKVLETTDDVFKDMAKSVKDSFSVIDKNTTKGLIEFNKALKVTNEILEKQEANNKKRVEVNDDLTKQEKKLITLRKKLNDGLSDEAVETEKLNTQIREQNKRRKESVNDSLGLVSAYAKESKALRKMKNDLKSNIIEMRKLGKSEKEIAQATKATTKEINKLDRELRDLDKSVGDSFREIGKYEEALEGLKDTAGNLGTALLAVGTGLALDKLTDSITQSRDAQLKLDKANNVFAGGASAVVNKSLDFIDRVSESSKRAAEETAKLEEQGSRLIKKSEELASTVNDKLLNFFDDEEEQRLEKKISLLSQEITVEQELYEVAKKAAVLRLNTADADANKENDNFIKNTEDAVKALNNLSENTQKVDIENNALNRSLSDQIEIQQKLKSISDDDTRSFKEVIDAKIKLVEVDKEVADGQELKAKNELQNQALNIGAELVAKGKISLNEALNITIDKANKLLKEETNLKALSSQAENDYTEAYKAYVEARTESSTTALETEEKLSKLYSDKLELDLDVLIDFHDKVKVVNEQIIADDTVSNTRRQALLEETKSLSDKSFNEQVKTLQDFVYKRIDLNSQLSDDQKALLKEKTEISDIEELLAIKDAKEFNKKLRQLGLSEIFETRTIEVIKEKIQSNYDLLESEKELNTALRKTNEIKEDIIDQEEQLEILRNKEIDTQEELDKAQSDLADKRLQNRLDAIDKELEVVEKGSLEEYTLNQEKNDILIEQETKAADKRIEIEEARIKKEKDAIARRQELLEKSVEVLDQIFAKSREKQNDALDKEIDTLETRIDDVKNAINNGNEEASQSLAELEKQRLEAEQKKEELRKKEIRDEKIIAGLQVLASNNGDVGKTVGDISLLLAALSNLPSFFDGTEDTGTVSNPLDSNGGRTAILHDNERVITAKQNERIGGISNDDLADLAQMHNNGNLNGGTTILQANNDNLILEVKEMTRAVKNIPIQSYNYDSKAKHHEQVIQTQNKKERLKTRASNLFK